MDFEQKALDLFLPKKIHDASLRESASATS
jgi:hypothetical protein